MRRRMIRAYPEYISDLGFKVDGILEGSCTLYKASNKDLVVTVKCGRVNGVKWEYNHVITESRVLERMKGVEGIVEKISFHQWINNYDSEFRHVDRLVALVRKYVEGRGAYEKLTNPDVLVNAVKALHESGISGLDLSPSNIIIDPTEKPYIIDLGLCVFKGENENFECWKYIDLKMLDGLFSGQL